MHNAKVQDKTDYGDEELRMLSIIKQVCARNMEDKIYEQEMDVMKTMHPLFIILLRIQRVSSPRLIRENEFVLFCLYKTTRVSSSLHSLWERRGITSRGLGFSYKTPKTGSLCATSAFFLLLEKKDRCSKY